MGRGRITGTPVNLRVQTSGKWCVLKYTLWNACLKYVFDATLSWELSLGRPLREQLWFRILSISDYTRRCSRTSIAHPATPSRITCTQSWLTAFSSLNRRCWFSPCAFQYVPFGILTPVKEKIGQRQSVCLTLYPSLNAFQNPAFPTVCVNATSFLKSFLIFPVEISQYINLPSSLPLLFFPVLAGLSLFHSSMFYK